MFEVDFGLKNVHGVATCSEVMKELSRKTYTHLLMDMSLDDGSALEILENIRVICPTLKIMVLAMQPESMYSRILEKYGILFYASKGGQEDDTYRKFRMFLNYEKPAPEFQ